MERKTVLITGASGGIGAAAAERFAAAGYAVAIHYYKGEAAARALADRLTSAGHEAATVRADLRNGAQARQMVDNVLEKFCQLDILICNAGVSWQGLLSDMTDEEWRALFSVNVDGVFHCCRAVIPHFILYVGTNWSLLRGGLLRLQSRSHRPHQGPGEGAGTLGHHGELCLSRPDRHAHERR